MTTLTDRLHNQARIVPIAPPRRVVKVTPQDGGALLVEQADGNTFTIPGDAEHEPLRAFIVYTMLAD